jgi:hypothetical protein
MTNAKTPVATEYNAYEAIRAAQIEIEKQESGKVAKRDMLSSAILACSDAQACFNKSDWKYARIRALDSLSYTVGVFSPVYQSVSDRGPHR